jgi:hypothetical protein
MTKLVPWGRFPAMIELPPESRARPRTKRLPKSFWKKMREDREAREMRWAQSMRRLKRYKRKTGHRKTR